MPGFCDGPENGGMLNRSRVVTAHSAPPSGWHLYIVSTVHLRHDGVFGRSNGIRWRRIARRHVLKGNLWSCEHVKGFMPSCKSVGGCTEWHGDTALKNSAACEETRTRGACMDRKGVRQSHRWNRFFMRRRRLCSGSKGGKTVRRSPDGIFAVERTGSIVKDRRMRLCYDEVIAVSSSPDRTVRCRNIERGASFKPLRRLYASSR